MSSETEGFGKRPWQAAWAAARASKPPEDQLRGAQRSFWAPVGPLHLAAIMQQQNNQRSDDCAD